jgi:hypothetical protein
MHLPGKKARTFGNMRRTPCIGSRGVTMLSDAHEKKANPFC